MHVGGTVSNLCYFSAHDYYWLNIIIHQRRLSYWKKCLFSENMILQTLARCCSDNIGAICDVYKFTSKDLMDLPRRCLKELIWEKFARFFCISCMTHACVLLCNMFWIVWFYVLLLFCILYFIVWFCVLLLLCASSSM